MIPDKFNKYFWDVDISSLNPSKNPLFVIQRLLDKGDKESVSWMLKSFDQEIIKKAFTTLRDFSPKIGKFWQLYFNLPESKVVCLQKPYLKMRKSHWPF